MKESDKYLIGKTRDEIRQLCQKMGESAFRGDQIFDWIYNKKSSSFDEMINLSKAFRLTLSQNFNINSLKIFAVKESLDKETTKFIFDTHDNKKIESVVIFEEDRTTLCVSTQVGCPLDCKFCATGQMGFKRNLSSGEILEQYIISSKNISKKITNVVYMGMGEPLINYDNTIKSLEILTDEKALGVSRHRITISTAGIPKKIIELANSPLRVKLAFSLHSCFEDIRSILMPINKKYSLKENIEALKYYSRQKDARITFEYSLFKDINDRDVDVEALAKLCSLFPSKVNLIPFNDISHIARDEISKNLKPTEIEKIEEFASKLRDRNITVFVRKTKGQDIAAACGQLAIKY